MHWGDSFFEYLQNTYLVHFTLRYWVGGGGWGRWCWESKRFVLNNKNNNTDTYLYLLGASRQNGIWSVFFLGEQQMMALHGVGGLVIIFILFSPLQADRDNSFALY